MTNKCFLSWLSAHNDNIDVCAVRVLRRGASLISSCARISGVDIDVFIFGTLNSVILSMFVICHIWHINNMFFSSLPENSIVYLTLMAAYLVLTFNKSRLNKYTALNLTYNNIELPNSYY